MKPGRWMLLCLLGFVLGCDGAKPEPQKSDEDTSSIGDQLAEELRAPQPAPAPAAEPIVEPIPVESDAPVEDSQEIAISEELWARIEQARDLAFRAVSPEPFYPFALYDGSEQDEVRRYKGKDINQVLATARMDMHEHAQSAYTIAHHAYLSGESGEDAAVIIEACEKLTGKCYRFGQRYELQEGDPTPQPKGNLTYMGECLSAFNVVIPEEADEP